MTPAALTQSTTDTSENAPRIKKVGWNPNSCAIQPPDRGAERCADALHRHHRALADVDAAGPGEDARDQPRHGDALQPRRHAIEDLHRKHAPRRDEGRSDHATDRQDEEGGEDDEPVTARLGAAHRDDRRADHHALRDDDHRCREDRGIALCLRHRERVKRQHRTIAEMEEGERSGQDQQRLAAKEDTKAIGFSGIAAGIPGAVLQPARRPMVDLVFGDHQHRDDREHPEQRGEHEHRAEAKFPAEKTGQPGTDHIARVIPRLVTAVLAIESALPREAERDPRDGRADRRAGDRGRDLRRGHDPEVLREPDQRRCEHGENAGDDHRQALLRRCVDQRAGRRGHQHAGHPADRHDGADRARRPCPCPAGTRRGTGRYRPAYRPS